MCSCSSHFLARSSEIIGETDDGVPMVPPLFYAILLCLKLSMLVQMRGGVGARLSMGENQRLKSICFRVQFGGRDGFMPSLYRVGKKTEPWLRELAPLARGKPRL